jgi:hypothetical protein
MLSEIYLAIFKTPNEDLRFLSHDSWGGLLTIMGYFTKVVEKIIVNFKEIQK